LQLPSRNGAASRWQYGTDGQCLGIAVHDHIIVGKNSHASMKDLLLV
jgi:DNA repair protein RadC